MDKCRLSIPSEARSVAVKVDNIILCWLSFLLFLSAVPSPVPGISALNKLPEHQPLPRALLSWGPQAKSHVNTNNEVARTCELRGRAPESPLKADRGRSEACLSVKPLKGHIARL